MTTPTFTTPPTSPQRTDAPPTFVSRANAFVAWFATFLAEMTTGVTWVAARVADIVGYTAAALASQNAAADSAVTAIQAPGTLATCSTSLNLPSVNATVSFTLDQTGKLFGLGQTL